MACGGTEGSLTIAPRPFASWQSLLHLFSPLEAQPAIHHGQTEMLPPPTFLWCRPPCIWFLLSKVLSMLSKNARDAHCWSLDAGATAPDRGAPPLQFLRQTADLLPGLMHKALGMVSGCQVGSI